MPRVIVTDAALRDKIERLKKYAKEHIFDRESIIKMVEGKETLPGNIPEFELFIEKDFRAVYTVEKQCGKIYEHLSLTHKEGWITVPEAEIILKEFGIADDIWGLDNVWIEEKVKAVNFIKLLPE